MNITLSSEQVKLIEAQLALGQFSSPEEVITKALQTLTQTRKHYWEWVEEVRSGVEEAEAELSRGEGIPLEIAIEQLQEKFRNFKPLNKFTLKTILGAVEHFSTTSNIQAEQIHQSPGPSFQVN